MRKKIKFPVWIVIMITMIGCMCISAAVTTYVTERTIKQTLYDITIKTETGKYPDWFMEWQNTVYLKENKTKD